MLKRLTLVLLSLAVAAYGLLRAASLPPLYGTLAAGFLLLAVLFLVRRTPPPDLPVHLGVAFVFLDLTFRRTRWEYLLEFFGHVDYLWVPAIAATMVANILFRGVKWRLLFPAGTVRTGALVEATAIGFMANNILPARAGEFIRAFIAADRHGLSKSSVLTTVLLERILDGMALTCLLVLLLVAAPLDRRQYAVYSVLAVGLYAAFLVGVVLFYLFRRFFEDLAAFGVRLVRPSLEASVRAWVGRVHDGLHAFRDLRAFGLFFLLTLLNWCFNWVTIWMCVASADLHRVFGITAVTPFFSSLFLLLLVCFAISVPSGPGGAGPYQYIVQLALQVMAPASATDPRLISAAAGFSIYLWIVQALPIILTGLVYYGRSGYSWRRLRSG